MSEDIGRVCCFYFENCHSLAIFESMTKFWENGWRFVIDSINDSGIQVNYVCPKCQLTEIGRFI